MPYNTVLEQRIDALLGRIGPVIKKHMFGGIGYMTDDKMCFGIHKDSLVLRTTVEKAEDLLKTGVARPFDITGRPMKGWVLISNDAVKTEDELLDYLNLGWAFALALESKS
jgi:TfoX/Sxy family transcriptional regulator of competence genes